MTIDVVSGAAGGQPAGGRAANTSATEASAASGNALPVSGGSVPAAAAQPRPAPEPIDLSRVIEQMNRFLRMNERDLNFRVDESSGRTIITVVNPSTGEIVRQIPPEELLQLARNLRAAGVLFQAVA
jgi:flagellar protein FlaG